MALKVGAGQQRVSISPKATGVEDNGKLETRKVILDATFKGSIQLRNSGVYPAVFVSRIFQYALHKASLGLGKTRGHGVVNSRIIKLGF